MNATAELGRHIQGVVEAGRQFKANILRAQTPNSSISLDTPKTNPNLLDPHVVPGHEDFTDPTFSAEPTRVGHKAKVVVGTLAGSVAGLVGVGMYSHMDNGATQANAAMDAAQGMHLPDQIHSSFTTNGAIDTDSKVISQPWKPFTAGDLQVSIPDGIQASEINADLTPMGIYDQTVVTTEFLEQNPQNIIGSFEVAAADGTDSERYIIAALATDKTKLFLYKAKRNTTNNLFDKKLVPTTVDAISIARPNAVSGDPLLSAGVLGNGVIIFGGGGDLNSNKTLLHLQFREEKRTVLVDMKEFGNLGPVMSIVPTSDNNKAIVTLRPGESQYGALFVAVDPQTRIATVTPMAVGELLDLRPSVEQPTAPGHQKFIARGYNSDIGGIHELDVDLANPKNIVETNLNTEYYFLANARYLNASGEVNDLATSQLSMKMININRKTGQETSLNYTTWLSNKTEIPGSSTKSFIITKLVPPIVDSQGKVHIWFGGVYHAGGSTGGDSHPIVGHYVLGEDPSTNPNALTIIDPHPSVKANLNEMRMGKTSTGTRIITAVTSVGEIIIPIGADGSLDPTAQIFGVGNGVGLPPTYQEFFPGIQRNTTQ